jgi:hypothetical protein
LARLKDSLDKISRRLPGDRYSAREWDWLLAGYAQTSGHAQTL